MRTVDPRASSVPQRSARRPVAMDKASEFLKEKLQEMIMRQAVSDMMNGMIAKVQDGDIVRLDAETGDLKLLVSDEELAKRDFAMFTNKAEHQTGFGRELFGVFRDNVGLAEMGASAVLPGGAE